MRETKIQIFFFDLGVASRNLPRNLPRRYYTKKQVVLVASRVRAFSVCACEAHSCEDRKQVVLEEQEPFPFLCVPLGAPLLFAVLGFTLLFQLRLCLEAMQLHARADRNRSRR